MKKLTLSQREDFYPWGLILKNPLFGVLKEMHLLSGSLSALSAIVIKLSVDADDYGEAMRALGEVSKQCRALDKLLADRENFPALQEVRFSIVFDIMEDPDAETEEDPRQSHKKFSKKAKSLKPTLNSNVLQSSMLLVRR